MIIYFNDTNNKIKKLNSFFNKTSNNLYYKFPSCQKNTLYYKKKLFKGIIGFVNNIILV